MLSLLGRGGTAEVYKAFHPALKREVAVKVILQEVVSDEDWVRRFRHEASSSSVVSTIRTFFPFTTLASTRAGPISS